MLPMTVSNNLVDGYVAYAQKLPEFRQGVSARRVEETNGLDFLLYQLVGSYVFALCLTIFANAITSVLPVGTEQEVSRVDASSVVALVHYYLTGRNGADAKSVRESVSFRRIVVDRGYSVPVSVKRTGPEDTSVFGDLAETVEELVFRWGGFARHSGISIVS